MYSRNNDNNLFWLLYDSIERQKDPIIVNRHLDRCYAMRGNGRKLQMIEKIGKLFSKLFDLTPRNVGMMICHVALGDSLGERNVAAIWTSKNISSIFLRLAGARPKFL